MRGATPLRFRSVRRPCLRCALLLPVMTVAVSGCNGTLPSQRFTSEVSLPIPESASNAPPPERLLTDIQGDHHVVDPRNLIPLAFNLQPDIRSSFQRYKSEEARYDFFYANRDSLTPRMRLDNSFAEQRANELVDRTRSHNVEFGVEKQFFDTSSMNVAAGFRTVDVNDGIGNQPYLRGDIRYPLAASRQRLSRTSEDIFRQNELNDARLSYIQTVRSQLQDVLFRFYAVRDLHREVNYRKEWSIDLKALRERMQSAPRPIPPADQQRLNAEIESVDSQIRVRTGRYEIDIARFKGAIGLPFNAVVEFEDTSFNPFIDDIHADLLQLSIETDPEIATLRNSVENAQVQLDLARRGTWDVALLLSASSNIEGRGDEEGNSDWTATVGLDVSHVDPRVTTSLSRQAQANIRRFTQAIAARENDIFVDTLEPLVRIDTLGQSREQLIASLPSFKENYETGVSEYFLGGLSIDDLLQRRINIFNQQDEISNLTFLVGANVAELCAATGKFFEFLAEDIPEAVPDSLLGE